METAGDHIGEVTRLLRAWSSGDEAAVDTLVLFVCEEIPRRAQRSVQQERPGGALRATVLVKEAYLRLVDPARSRQTIAVDEAVGALARVDERKDRVVKLRSFGGLGVRKTSPEVVMRGWKVAKVWLLREMSGGGRGS